MDFAQTLLDAAGLNAPGDMQGRSIVPIMRGQRPADWRTSFYYHYYEWPTPHRVRPHYGVVTDRYKLVKFYATGEDFAELFDRERDPLELKSYYDDPAYAETKAQLETELGRLRRELKLPEETPRDFFGKQGPAPGNQKQVSEGGARAQKARQP